MTPSPDQEIALDMFAVKVLLHCLLVNVAKLDAGLLPALHRQTVQFVDGIDGPEAAKDHLRQRLATALATIEADAQRHSRPSN